MCVCIYIYIYTYASQGTPRGQTALREPCPVKTRGFQEYC